MNQGHVHPSSLGKTYFKNFRVWLGVSKSFPRRFMKSQIMSGRWSNGYPLSHMLSSLGLIQFPHRDCSSFTIAKTALSVRFSLASWRIMRQGSQQIRKATFLCLGNPCELYFVFSHVQNKIISLGWCRSWYENLALILKEDNGVARKKWPTSSPKFFTCRNKVIFHKLMFILVWNSFPWVK